MKTVLYSKIIFIFILTSIWTIVVSQDKFIYYQDFKSDYNNNPNLEVLNYGYDLLYVLLLDTTNILHFYEYDSELEDLYNGYSFGLKFDESTVGFVAQISTIDELFKSNILMNKVFYCIMDIETQQVFRPKINYPIYIKENTAIVEIQMGETFDVYCIKLSERVIQINWLGGVME